MKASLVIDYHLDNKVFDINDKNVNRDNYAYSIWLLREYLLAQDINLATCDINSTLESSVALYFDFSDKSSEINNKKSYLFLFESEVIRPDNWVVKNHNDFHKIFTWNDDWVDNKKYFKINFSHKFPESLTVYRKCMLPFECKKLCTLISGNKIVNHTLELYSERVKTIRWFEEHATDEFDLYGIGWDKYIPGNRYARFLLSKMGKLSKLFTTEFPSYKGIVGSKFETLSNYKFAICYENAQMIPGYITEKIFDCFFAGCVPIYWGAPNITDHIPKNCFIDRRDFQSHEELYSFINKMPEKEYVEIQMNIGNYLFSKQAAPYRAETFANTIVEHILNDQE